MFKKSQSMIVMTILGLLLIVPSFSQSYPLSGSPKLSFFCLPGGWNVKYQSITDAPITKELMKRTGVQLDYIVPSMAQGLDQLNLRIASQDLPDMISWDWVNFPGGPEKAMKDKVIVRLNEAMAKWAPNLTAYLKAHPDVDRMVKTADGDYYVFPFLRGDATLQTYQGPMLRGDWLDELGLQVPTTIDEWYTVLKAFKEKKGATLAFRSLGGTFGEYTSPAFVGAFGTVVNWDNGFFQENGKIKWGPNESGFKDFIMLWRKWYAEGLIDQDIALMDQKLLDSKVTSGKVGALVGNLGGMMGTFTNMMKTIDPKFRLVAAPYPVLKKGDTPRFGQRDLAYTPAGSVAITSKCTNLEAAVRFLDYGYSQEGSMLYNFGIDGKSYSMVNGYPKYSAYITANPDGWSMAEALGGYVQSIAGGPFVQDKRYGEQYFVLPNQQVAMKVWSTTDMDKYQIPRLSIPPTESSEFSRIRNELRTLTSEVMTMTILGGSLDKLNSFPANIKKIGVDRLIAIEQASLNAYNRN